MQRRLSPYPLFFRMHWKEYRRKLHKRWGGESDKSHVIPAILWRLNGDDIQTTWLHTMAVILPIDAYITLTQLVRLRNVKEQRRLAERGDVQTVDTLPYLDDDRLNSLMELASNRLHRLLCPEHKLTWSQRFLKWIGLMDYPTPTTSPQEISIITLAGMVCGRIGDDRKAIRRRRELHQPSRVRHPMLPAPGLSRRLWNYFQGGRIFLWISFILGGPLAGAIGDALFYWRWHRWDYPTLKNVNLPEPTGGLDWMT